MAFYVGFAAYVSYDNNQQEKQQTQVINDKQ